MGRIKKKNQEGYIQCPICEKAFKLKDEQFRSMFKLFVNESLHESIKDFITEKPHNIEIIKKEPFFQHLNQYQHCPLSRCNLCHSSNPGSLKLFTTRHQRNFHIKQKHQDKEQIKGRTGFNALIREEVLRQCQNQINKMMDLQKDYNLIYPTIEVRITGYKGESKDLIEKESLHKKEIKKEEHYAKIKKTKTVNKHNKIIKDQKDLMELHGLEMVITPALSVPDSTDSSDTDPDSELNIFYKLEFKHLEALGIYRPKQEWDKIKTYINNVEDDIYFVYYQGGLFLEDRPIDEVEVEDLDEPIYLQSEDKETFKLVEDQFSCHGILPTE